MQETAVKDLVWILFGIVGIVITFYVFGAELPLYLLLATIGLLLYVYSKNPEVKLVSGIVGRLFATLFVISLLYYFGTRTFFPDDPFTFRFLKIGILSSLDFFNQVSDFIGKLVLKSIDIIIP